MRQRRIPPTVMRAMFSGDTETLRALGKKGAEAKKKNEISRMVAEAIQRMREANELLCPVD